MRLYFVRHATASSRSTWTKDDDLRPLTRTGRQRFSDSATSLVRAGALVPELVITSPILRARQTAELLGKAMGGRVPLIEDARLAHGFDAGVLAAVLGEHSDVRSLAIVGHNPSFEDVLSDVIGGGQVDVRKGAIALVDVDDPTGPSGTLEWIAPPALFRVAT